MKRTRRYIFNTLTFGTAAVQRLFGAGADVQERAAKAAEDTKKLISLAIRGGLAFGSYS